MILQIPVANNVKAVPEIEHTVEVSDTKTGIKPLEAVTYVVITTPASPTLKVAELKVDASVCAACETTADTVCVSTE